MTSTVAETARILESPIQLLVLSRWLGARTAVVPRNVHLDYLAADGRCDPGWFRPGETRIGDHSRPE